MEHEDLIRKHLGVNTPDWIVANVQKAIDEALRQPPVISSVCSCDNVHGEIETKTNYCWYCLKTIKEQTDL
jgi:hypothetical protein